MKRVRIGRVPVAVLIATLLAGCTVGPDWQRPKTDAPAGWRVEPSQAAEIANLRWWERFDDPALNELIATALQENRDLRQAAARVDQFLGALRTTRSQFYPQFNYNGGATTNRLSENGQPPLSPGANRDYDLYTAALGASWQIDLFGRVRRLAESSQAQVYASEQGRRGVVLSVVAGVTTGYVALRALDRQLEIAQITAKNFEETQKLFEMRFYGGVISEVELAQVQSQYQQALAAIPSLERQIALQENLLSILLGRNPGAIPRGKTIDQLSLPPVPGDLPSTLLERRPDILQAEQLLRSANANIGAAKALYYPTLSLTGALGFTSTSLDNFANGSSTAGSLGASLVGPIFTFGRIEGQVKTAEAAREESLAFYQQVVLNAFRETNDALIGVKKRTEERDALVKRVEALRTYARLSRARFDGGVSSYLEVIYAENELFAAELNAVGALAQRYAELINVYKALGGGWVDVADPLGPKPGTRDDKAAPASATTAALVAPAAPAAMAEPPRAQPVSAKDDGIEVHREGDTTVVDVQRGRGIGGVEVKVPRSGPQSVLFRFHDFPALESFKVRSARGELDCGSQRREGQAARTVCRTRGQEVDAVRIWGNVIAVRIPDTVLREPGESAEVRWVDQWR
ncbi:MAG: efflux transporter outer membrane subunit [Burkholderiales bacterium]|nr:efflux transporter outer membrane subunit [Burkholderiales bacterium]